MVWYNCSMDKVERRKPGTQTPEGFNEQTRLSRIRYRTKLRDDVRSHYGNQCACCGETEYVFLTLDYTQNDGAQHRQRLRPTRSNLGIYRDARKRDYPDYYQLLCMNCNYGKYRNNGVCPHQDEGVH